MSGQVKLDTLKWDERGLIAVVAQDDRTGTVRMVAWANAEAVGRTLETNEAHFFSRSRQALWKKGESSGNVLKVRRVWVDCDRDTLIYAVDPTGPSCHTGAESCFFESLDAIQSSDGANSLGEFQEGVQAEPFFARFFGVLKARSGADQSKSYTKHLLDAGVPKINEKVREEAGEFCDALASESDARVASEAADLMYHLCVGLVARGVDYEAVLSTLRERFGTSGIDEKSSRSKSD